MTKITDIPKKIHIQLDYNNELEHEDVASFNDWHEDATWCSDKLNKTDVPFYSLEEVRRRVQAAFEIGWHTRTNRNASECQGLMENYITLLLDE